MCPHFLAGNGSRSQILTDLFETYMITYTDDLKHHINSNISSDFFHLHPALGMQEPKQKETAQQKASNRNVTQQTSSISGLAQSLSDIGGLAQSVSELSEIAQNKPLPADTEEDISAITKPNGKTGVAFGLLEGRPGGRIKIILPLSQDVADDASDIRFRFYIGYKKKNLFQMISDRSLPYNKWTYLCDASTEDFAIYYTPRPEAAGGTLSIFDVYKKSCHLNKAYDNASIYYRAVAPDTLEYTVISNDNFDSAKLLENVVKVELTY